MELLNFSRRSFGICTAIALLAGCSGGGPPATLGIPPAQRAAGATIQIKPRPDFRPSWMSPKAKEGSLLYVAGEDTGDVYVYSYPKR